jgi:hypothetical protein
MEKQDMPYQNQIKKTIALVSPEDERGNPIGRPVEVYSDASIVLGEPVGEAVTRDERRIQVYKLEICTETECREIRGVYGSQEFNQEDTISILPRENEVKIGYGAFGEPIISSPTVLSADRITDDGKRYPLTPTRIVPGEELKIQIYGTYREAGRLPDGTPVVTENVRLRIKAKELEEQLYAGADFKKHYEK